MRSLHAIFEKVVYSGVRIWRPVTYFHSVEDANTPGRGVTSPAPQLRSHQSSHGLVAFPLCRLRPCYGE